jgi:outer membrane biosynthesis protein TonB
VKSDSQKISISAFAGALLLSTLSSVVSADETIFPSRYRTLQSTAPANCNVWVAPLPERRIKVDLPREARQLEGSAVLTINIDQTGKFAGLVEALTNQEAFVQAAKDSLQYWSFVPARCNGVAVATQAKIYFNFRNESFVAYASGRGPM